MRYRKHKQKAELEICPALAVTTSSLIKMSGANSSSPADGVGANPNSQGTPDDAKPRLTEEEKKQNHIASGKERG